MSALESAWQALPDIRDVEPYATTLAALAIVGIAVQALLQRRSVRADEARLARESAVFVYSVFGSEEFRQLRKIVGAKHDQSIERMSDDTKGAFRGVLHNYGIVGLAFVEGGVTARVVESYWGSILAKDWARLQTFVAEERRKNPKLHRNTEAMVEAVEKIRRGK